MDGSDGVEGEEENEGDVELRGEKNKIVEGSQWIHRVSLGLFRSFDCRICGWGESLKALIDPCPTGRILPHDWGMIQNKKHFWKVLSHLSYQWLTHTQSHLELWGLGNLIENLALPKPFSPAPSHKTSLLKGRGKGSGLFLAGDFLPWTPHHGLLPSFRFLKEQRPLLEDNKMQCVWFTFLISLRNR